MEPTPPEPNPDSSNRQRNVVNLRSLGSPSVGGTVVGLLCVGVLLCASMPMLGSQSAIAGGPPQVRCDENAQQIGPEGARAGVTIEKGDRGQVADAPQESPGMRAYIDPVTGEFGVPPPGEAPSPEALAPGAAYSTSDEGLVETPSPVPGGGVMIDLQGRFRGPLTATLDADGKMKMQHTPCQETSAAGQ